MFYKVNLWPRYKYGTIMYLFEDKYRYVEIPFGGEKKNKERASFSHCSESGDYHL